MPSETTDGEKDYKVGYGKPPTAGQFKKGQSGNPRGSSASRRKTKPAFGNIFQEKLGSEVVVLENGKPVRRTRKHLGVRKLVEAAAKGSIPALKDMLELQKANDPSPSSDDHYTMGLVESLAWGPPEVLLYKPDTIVIREPAPDAVPSAGSSARRPAGKRRQQKRSDEPRDQTWKSLVRFELWRQVSVTDRATGSARTMILRDAILEQLAIAFASGKKGAAKLAVQLNEKVEKRSNKLIPVVYIPHDYVIPPKCDDPRGYPPGHEFNKTWKKHFPIPDYSKESEET